MYEIRRGQASQTIRLAAGSLELDNAGGPMLSPGETLMGLWYQFGVQVADSTQVIGHYARLMAVGVALTQGSPPPAPPLPLDAPNGDTWLWWERVNFLPDGMDGFQAPNGQLGVRRTNSRRASGAVSSSLWIAWQGGAAYGDIFQVIVGWSAIVLNPDMPMALADRGVRRLELV